MVGFRLFSRSDENLDLLRKRIHEKVFEDIIERSDVSMELIEKTDPDSPFLADMRETGNLPLDFQAIYDLTVEMANSDESKDLTLFS